MLRVHRVYLWRMSRLRGHVHLESPSLIPNPEQRPIEQHAARADQLPRSSWVPAMSNSGREMESIPDRHQVKDF
jgi:hypothetical protein